MAKGWSKIAPKGREKFHRLSDKQAPCLICCEARLHLRLAAPCIGEMCCKLTKPTSTFRAQQVLPTAVQGPPALWSADKTAARSQGSSRPLADFLEALGGCRLRTQNPNSI